MPVLRNPRHEKFAQLVSGGIKPTEAYVSLGYSRNGAPQSANNLLNRTEVRERVNEILAAAAQSTAQQVSFDHQRVLRRLDVLSRKAEDLGQVSAAVRAEELIGRARGLFVERSENVAIDLAKLNAAQQEQLERMLEEIAFKDDPEGLKKWREGEPRPSEAIQ